MPINWYERAELDKMIKYLIVPSEVILDIGCGIRPQEFTKPLIHICCEVHEEYLAALRDGHPDTNFVIMKGLAQDVLRWMPDRSVDTIFMLDFIEHVDKEVGLSIISECERIARKQIVIFTPLGFMKQDYEKGEIDGWGLRGSEWQIHRSGWDPEDFGDEWNILASHIYHTINGKGDPFVPPFGALFAIKNIKPSESENGNGIEASKGNILPSQVASWLEAAEHLAKKENNLQILEAELNRRYVLLVDNENKALEKENRLMEKENRLMDHENALQKRNDLIEDLNQRLNKQDLSLQEREINLQTRMNNFDKRNIFGVAFWKKAYRKVKYIMVAKG